MTSVFVTGTDTEVGKTFISVGLIELFKQQGLKAAGMKPIASGCEQTPEGLRNDDAVALQQHANVELDYELINPYAFEPAIAPHIAAEQTAINCSREMQLANCWVGVNYITLHHGQSLAYRGHLESALALFDNASQLAEEHLGMDNGLQSMAMCLTAEIYYQMGQLDKAKKLLEQGITALELRDCWYDIYAVTFKLAINLALADNDKSACDDYLSRGKKIVIKRKLWRLEMLLDVFAQKVALHFNDNYLFEELNNKIIREKYWLEELCLWKAKEEYHVIQAIYFLQKNASSKALFHTEKLLKICMDSKQIIYISKAKIIQALAYSSTDNNNKAFKILHEVCLDCARYKIKQVFYEVPASIESLLLKFKKHNGELLKKLESIEDYVVIEDYLHAVNQTYEIKLRQEGYSNLTPENIDSKDSKGILEKLKRVWQEHRDDDWGEFSNEEITRYICEKIALEETNFLSDKTKDQFRSLYRLIAERIRQYQNTATKTDLEKFQKKK